MSAHSKDGFPFPRRPFAPFCAQTRFTSAFPRVCALGVPVGADGGMLDPAFLRESGFLERLMFLAETTATVLKSSKSPAQATENASVRAFLALDALLTPALSLSIACGELESAVVSSINKLCNDGTDCAVPAAA